MSTIAEPRTAAPAVPDPSPPPGPPDASSAPPRAGLMSPDGAEPAPNTQAEEPAPERTWTDRLLMLTQVFGGLIVGLIGFAASYDNLRDLAVREGFGTLSPYVPIGIDAGIMVAYAADLRALRRGRPQPGLRRVGHTLTLATVVLNASTGGGISADPIRALYHAAMPCLFVFVVETTRGGIAKRSKVAVEGIPAHRWLLFPMDSWRMYRRMRRWNITSYRRAVAMEQERTVYREMLDLAHKDKGGWTKAPADERLPMTMARFGLSVDEALALPQKEEERRLEREAQQARAKDVAQAEREARRAEDEIARQERWAAVEEARLKAEAEVGRAAATSTAAQAVAEQEAARRAAAARRLTTEEARRAEAEEQAEKSARQAEAEARQQEAERKAAEHEQKKQAAAQAAAIAKADAERKEREAAEDVKRRKEAERQAAEHEAAASEAAERAAEARERAARTELRAVELEDEAGLGRPERGARRVARMVLAEGTRDVKAVSLADIMSALSVSESTAGERRKAAAQLLASGYDPEREQREGRVNHMPQL